MGSISIWHWIVVIVVVLLLFGRNKISDLMGDVAQGIKAFKKGMADDDKPADAAKTDPVKIIDHQTPPASGASAPGEVKGHAESERRVVS
jgi:sec-independent protein translocase protein TatA